MISSFQYFSFLPGGMANFFKISKIKTFIYNFQNNFSFQNFLGGINVIFFFHFPRLVCLKMFSKLKNENFHFKFQNDFFFQFVIPL
jgi:hypothetical protein